MKNKYLGWIKFSFLGFFILIAGSDFSQNINTIAGDGSAGYFGDNGQATVSEIYFPSGIAIDNQGNYYIADQFNNCIRKVTTGGIITTYAGNGVGGASGDGGPATAAEIGAPGVALDNAGNIYIADAGSRIRKVNTAGIISTFAGNGSAGYSGDGVQATATEINGPTGAVVDNRGNVYIVDDYNSRIRKVNSSGIITTYAGNGIAGYSGDDAAATAAELNVPWGISIDVSGNIYIADRSNNAIRKVNTAGIISTLAGNHIQGYSGDGGAATSAELDYTPGVTVDASGNVYFLDQNNNRVRKVNKLGVITTFAGNGIEGYSGDGGSATAAEVNRPAAIGVDNSENVYIVDQFNNRVREVIVSHTSINSISQSSSSVSIYPNPSNGQFTINFSYAEPVSASNESSSGQAQNIVEIYNILGEKVYSYHQITKSSNYEIDLSGQPNGVYFYRVVGDYGNVCSRGKFVIEK